MSTTDTELVGVAEVAEMANVSNSVICNWKRRDINFPAPHTVLRQGPIWLRADIRRYLAMRKFFRGH